MQGNFHLSKNPRERFYMFFKTCVIFNIKNIKSAWVSQFSPTVLPVIKAQINILYKIKYLLYRLVYLEEENKYNPLIPSMPNLISFFRHLKQVI